MAKVKFWEKPGCQGNRKQKEILLASGHELEVHNLLTESWSAETLRPFLANLPVAQWFNPTNPQIKAGEIVPQELDEEQALALMLDEPLLIVRPLMQVGSQRMAGFDVARVDSWIGLLKASIGERDPQNCPCVTQVCVPD
jgi:nitrogenase-associated protein